MKCPKCGTQNREGRKFCSQCGSKLGWKCPKCGFDNEADEQFCGECGTKFGSESPGKNIPRLEDMQDRLYIPEPLRKRMDEASLGMEGENRLVTALFADISGFTTISQQLSPEATVEKINRCFQVITDAIYRYEGSVNRFIGDCVLAFFGAPLTHENDPERSILAALDMQKAVSELGMSISIGINTGMTYFGPIGTQKHQEFSAYGHDVNLAKRLQETAEPGQILVGAGIYRLTRRAFDFQPMDALELRGIREPVTIYQVLGVKEHPEKLRGIEGLRARMIGREHEFSELKEAADAWLDGKGQIVSIIGEAGIGKSRLVKELKDYLIRVFQLC